MNLGSRIAELRKEKNLSQEKLAELLGVSRQAVTKWESGKSFPDTENLLRLSEIFGISMDELCFNEKAKEQKAKIHPAGHILALLAPVMVAAYCIIGGISGNFSGELLILFLILAFPMDLFLHLIFWGMVKSGDFSMLAGYDSSIKYDTEGMKRYLAGLDFMLGFETASYLFLMISAALIVPEFEINVFLIFGYIISFIAGIFFMGYKFGDKIYLDPKDVEKAKCFLPSSAVMMAIIVVSVAAFIMAFELKGMENNTVPALGMCGLMFLSMGFALAGYLFEQRRLKKTEDGAPLFGKAFIVLNIAAIAVIILMFF